MKAVTFDQEALDRHAARLAEQVACDMPPGGYDAVVGIRRGGSLVCDAFCRHFPAGALRLRADVWLQRSSTKRKTPAVAAFLRRLPYGVLNLMRMAEARLLALRHRARGHHEERKVEIPAPLAGMLTSVAAPRVLLIDDAIDSGETLRAVVAAIKDVNEASDVRVAVLTVTTSRPVADADYYIYHNHTLIRFPWSNDYKNPVAGQLS